MSNNVFANGREIACKSGSGKTLAAFPDVCFTPPQTPATPPGVPVPYPLTSGDSDTNDGTRSVIISGKEVMLKNKSNFKRGTGDEAGCAPKKGVVTSKNTGKMYFCAWSMDVKIEGENSVRHFDITTSNHASMPGNTPTWPFIDTNAIAPGGACHDNYKAEREACQKYEGEEQIDLMKGERRFVPNQDTVNLQQSYANWRQSGSWSPPPGAAPNGKTPAQNAQCNDPACNRARRCLLVPYTATGSPLCCQGQQAHHLVEVHSFTMRGRGAGRGVESPFNPEGSMGQYRGERAPCVCAYGGKSTPGQHFDLHSVQGLAEKRAMDAASPANRSMAWNYGQAREAGVTAMEATFPECDPACIRSQLNAYHKQPGMDINDDTPLRTHPPGLTAAQIRRGFELMAQLAQRIARRATGL